MGYKLTIKNVLFIFYNYELYIISYGNLDNESNGATIFCQNPLFPL